LWDSTDFHPLGIKELAKDKLEDMLIHKQSNCVYIISSKANISTIYICPFDQFVEINETIQPLVNKSSKEVFVKKNSLLSIDMKNKFFRIFLLILKTLRSLL